MEYLKEINHKRNILEQKLYDANKMNICWNL